MLNYQILITRSFPTIPSPSLFHSLNGDAIAPQTETHTPWPVSKKKSAMISRWTSTLAAFDRARSLNPDAETHDEKNSLPIFVMFLDDAPYIWTSGRLCDFKGCEGRNDLVPKAILGWFWSANRVKVSPTNQVGYERRSPSTEHRARRAWRVCIGISHKKHMWRNSADILLI